MTKQQNKKYNFLKYDVLIYLILTYVYQLNV